MLPFSIFTRWALFQNWDFCSFPALMWMKQTLSCSLLSWKSNVHQMMLDCTIFIQLASGSVLSHLNLCQFFFLLTLSAPHCSHSWNMRESLQASQLRNWRRPRQAFSLQRGTLTATIFSVTSGPKQWIWVSDGWKGTRTSSRDCGVATLWLRHTKCVL